MQILNEKKTNFIKKIGVFKIQNYCVLTFKKYKSNAIHRKLWVYTKCLLYLCECVVQMQETQSLIQMPKMLIKLLTLTLGIKNQGDLMSEREISRNHSNDTKIDIPVFSLN